MSILDAWIKDLGFIKANFIGVKRYQFDSSAQGDSDVRIVSICEIVTPPTRNEKHLHISGFGEKRAKKILSGFFNYDLMPPIVIEKLPDESQSSSEKYRLHDGYHRFYISKHLGMEEIPVIIKPSLLDDQ